MGTGASANKKEAAAPAKGGTKQKKADKAAGVKAAAVKNGGASAKQKKGEEPPKKEEQPKLVVKEVDTLVIEIGTDGEAVERGVEIDEAEQIFVVIDPRSGNTVSDVKFLNDPDVLRKVMMGGGGKTMLKVFVLLPSTTSSKAHLMNAHMAVYWLMHWFQQNPCFIRTDDYYHNGDEIMKEMVEQDKRVYPAEELDNMKQMIELVSTSLWEKRAYVHWPVGYGLEEGEVDPCTALSEIGPLLCEEQALARVGEAPPENGSATLAIIATEVPTVFLTFSEDAAAAFGEKCEGAEMLIVTDELLEKTANGELEGELGGIGTEDADPVLLVSPADLVSPPDGPSLFVKFVTTLRETNPSQTLCVVLADESVDAHKENLWLIPALHCLIENADVVILATNDEVKDVHDFFQRARYERSDIGKLAMFQLIGFPRLHFFTMGTAVGGAELEDGEILFPAVTVGPEPGNEALPAVEKFKTADNWAIFPNLPHERVIPGEDDFPGASLIVPVKLLTSIFTALCEKLAGVCEEGPSWAVAFGEDFSRDDEQLVEAQSNLQDLCAEFTQYLEATATEEAAEE